MSATDMVMITITGKLAYADEITVSQAAQIVAFLHSGSAPSASAFAPAHEVAGLVTPQRRATTSSPRDALEAAGAKTNPERIVAFALHISQRTDKDSFALDDVRPLFRQSREATPGNLSRDLDAAIRAGWVAEAGNKGEYYVTSKAHGVLETGFDPIRTRGNSGKSRAPAAKRARRTSTPTPDAFAEKDVSTTIDGYPDYHKLKTRTEKFLWAVNAAKVLGVDAVTNQEVVWLTDKLGDGIASSDIAANFRQNHKAGYVNRSTADQRIRILPRGIDRLKELATGVTK